jgi:hypothetical protein
MVALVFDLRISAFCSRNPLTLRSAWRKLNAANTRKSSMRERESRTATAEMLQGLLIGLLSLIAVVSAHAQVASVDFQVIHLSGIRGSVVNYLAVRTQDEWIKFWQSASLEPTNAGDPPPTATAPRPPPPKIDFALFILLIAESGVKPSSGYTTIFESVRTVPGPTGKMMTSVHIVEIAPGPSCPRLTELSSSVSYALIPQTTNEIRFSISRADSNCSIQ